jgi:hypothetical protein
MRAGCAFSSLKQYTDAKYVYCCVRHEYSTLCCASIRQSWSAQVLDCVAGARFSSPLQQPASTTTQPVSRCDTLQRQRQLFLLDETLHTISGAYLMCMPVTEMKSVCVHLSLSCQIYSLQLEKMTNGVECLRTAHRTKNVTRNGS